MKQYDEYESLDAEAAASAFYPIHHLEVEVVRYLIEKFHQQIMAA
ncbi:MAG: hypothetical protein OTJ43_03075 [Dehalococcoidia bacterium]|nr:hypothetical protein [Dehalococcoidia bacterium]